VTREATAGGGSPDTVLARVGDRDVTIADWIGAWIDTHPPGSKSPTPQEAQGFLEVLIDRELATAAALRRSFPWTDQDRADTVAVRDRLALRAALDAVVAEAHRALPDSAGAEAAGVLARERAVAGLEAHWSDAELERLAAAFAALAPPSSDSSLASQIRALSAAPRLDSTQAGAVVVAKAIHSARPSTMKTARPSTPGTGDARPDARSYRTSAFSRDSRSECESGSQAV